MPAQDPYAAAAWVAGGPANRLFAVDPSDDAELPFVTTALYIGTGGDVAVTDRRTGAVVVFRDLAGGTGLPVRVAQVLATGTTATDLVGLA